MHNYQIIFLSIILLMISSCEEQETESTQKSTVEENAYLGQKAPGLIPQTFAPGLVSTDNWEYSGVFNPIMDEFYFLREVADTAGGFKQEFVMFQKRGGEWHDNVISPRKGQPFVSPDGNTLHLGNQYMERTKTGWSEVKKLGAPFDEFPIMRLTSSLNGTYFFDEFKSDLTGDIRYSRRIDGKYEEPKLLGKSINTGKSFHPFIAPDESYLLFDSSRSGGHGDSDIYISFRQPDGSWGDPKNLGDKINTEAWEASASVTPDGKYLFFNRVVGPKDEWNVDLFWVDIKAIEGLRNK